jgi:hypothetical protein
MRIQKQHLEKASGSFVFAFGLAAFLFQLKSYLKYFPPLPGHEIIRLIPEEFNKIIPESATLQVVADGFQWVRSMQAFAFSSGPSYIKELSPFSPSSPCRRRALSGFRSRKARGISFSLTRSLIVFLSGRKVGGFFLWA